MPPTTDNSFNKPLKKPDLPKPITLYVHTYFKSVVGDRARLRMHGVNYFMKRPNTKKCVSDSHEDWNCMKWIKRNCREFYCYNEDHITLVFYTLDFNKTPLV